VRHTVVYTYHNTNLPGLAFVLVKSSDSRAMSTAEVPVVDLFSFLLKNTPQTLLIVLVVFVIYLVLLDVINAARKPFLDPTKWKSLQLIDKKVLTHNTRRFRFAMPRKDQLLGLPVGQHITIKATLPDGTEVMRPYTPTSDGQARGYVEFVIKVYPQGKMSQALDALAVGDSLMFKGPKGRFQYEVGAKRAIGMLAGGTGITPMFQVAQAMLQNPNEKTTISLIFANVSIDDILLKDELEDLAKRNPGRFSVYYVLNEAPSGWKGGVGFITSEMIAGHLPAPGSDVLIMRCGPAPMMRAMEGHLEALGYSQEQQFQF
jgi:cytochrome-b5 reductase